MVRRLSAKSFSFFPLVSSIVKKNIQQQLLFLFSFRGADEQIQVKDFATCSRRFRCHFKREEDSAVDSAAELLVDKGYDCNDGFKVLGTDPFVAIVSVLAVVAVFCLLTYVFFQLSRERRRKQKEKKEKAIGMRILSPMTPSQRDRLLKEKMEKQTQDGAISSPESSPTLPVPGLLTLSESSLPDPTKEAAKVEDDETSDESEYEDPRKTKKRKVKVVLENTEEGDDDEKSEGESTTLTHSDATDLEDD